MKTTNTKTYRFTTKDELMDEIRYLSDEMRRLQFIAEQWAQSEGTPLPFDDYEYESPIDYQHEYYKQKQLKKGKKAPKQQRKVRPTNRHIAKLAASGEFTYEQLTWYLLAHRCEFSRNGIKKAFHRGTDYIQQAIKEMDERVMEIIEEERKTPFDVLVEWELQYVKKKG